MLARTVDAGLLCAAAEKMSDERILMQIRGKDCAALEVWYHKVCYSNYTKFLTRDNETKNEKSTSSPPMYSKSYEVFCKNVIETEIIENREIMYMKDLLHKFVSTAHEVENVHASNYRAYKLKQQLSKSYPQLVFCLPKKRNVSEIVYVENLNSSELVEEHMLCKSENIMESDEEWEVNDELNGEKTKMKTG